MNQPQRRNLGVGKSVRRLPEEGRRRAPELRTRVLDAAVSLLSERGYGATSLQRVAERADLSLGSVQHQFATRAEMMLAIMELALSENVTHISSAIEGVDDLASLIHGVVEAGWRVIQRPIFIAALEIVNGTRSDPGLAEHTAAILRETDLRGMEMIRVKGLDLGIALEAQGETFLVIYRSMMRGLALDSAQGTPEATLRRSLEVFETMLMQWARHNIETA